MKLIDIINGTLRDPFTGDLYEGLIKTVELEKVLDIVERKFPTFDIFPDREGILRIEFAPKYLRKKDSNYIGDIPDPRIVEVLALLNNLGYFPSTVQSHSGQSRLDGEIKYTPEAFRSLITVEQPGYLSFVFEPKYDPVVDVPQYIYHITDERYVDKIKKTGLKPRALNKRSTHEARIYFSVTKEASDFLWDRLKVHIPKGRGVLLTIDTAELDTTFYNDPNFDQDGVYTYSNISPKHIINYTKLEENQ